MKTGIFLSYRGLGANLLHLSYCHEIAKKFGPVSLITLNHKINDVLKFDNSFTEISVEDDGDGYPFDIISKIGEPYLKSFKSSKKSKSGLGLGIFIGKTLLEKNFAIINCRNSKTRTGAEVIIKWKNKDLFNI